MFSDSPAAPRTPRRRTRSTPSSVRRGGCRADWSPRAEGPSRSSARTRGRRRAPSRARSARAPGREPRSARPTGRRRSLGPREAEAALGDHVAVDLAGAGVDRGAEREPQHVLDACRARARSGRSSCAARRARSPRSAPRPGRSSASELNSFDIGPSAVCWTPASAIHARAALQQARRPRGRWRCDPSASRTSGVVDARGSPSSSAASAAHASAAPSIRGDGRAEPGRRARPGARPSSSSSPRRRRRCATRRTRARRCRR